MKRKKGRSKTIKVSFPPVAYHWLMIKGLEFGSPQNYIRYLVYTDVLGGERKQVVNVEEQVEEHYAPPPPPPPLPVQALPAQARDVRSELMGELQKVLRKRRVEMERYAQR